MDATEITAEIARLAALLPAALKSEDWDSDYAAVLTHQSVTLTHLAAATDVIASAAEDMDDTQWETVLYETGRTHTALTTIATNLMAAADAADNSQAEMSAQYGPANTRDHVDQSGRILVLPASRLKVGGPAVMSKHRPRRVLAVDVESKPGKVVLTVAGVGAMTKHLDDDVWVAPERVPVAAN